MKKIRTVTTRPKREGERDGLDYHFRTRSEFEEMVRNGELLEYTTIHGNLYGSPKRQVMEDLDRGANVLLELDTQGAKSVRAMKISAVFIFILPPDIAELQKRLANRKTENDEQQSRRLARAKEEIAESDKFDVKIVNQSVEETVEKIKVFLKEKKVL